MTLDEGPTVIGNSTMTPDSGYSVLIVGASFTGDLAALLAGPMQPAGAFYIDDGTSEIKEWVHVSWNSSSMHIGFFVKTGAGPYILHSTIGEPWSVDLTSLVP